MNLKNLVTLTFEKNVGTPDRVFRVLSGGGVIGVGWIVALPLWARIALTAFGVMWTATGVLSRCSIYYLLGYSTRTAPRSSK